MPSCRCPATTSPPVITLRRPSDHDRSTSRPSRATIITRIDRDIRPDCRVWTIIDRNLLTIADPDGSRRRFSRLPTIPRSAAPPSGRVTDLPFPAATRIFRLTTALTARRTVSSIICADIITRRSESPTATTSDRSATSIRSVSDG